MGNGTHRTTGGNLIDATGWTEQQIQDFISLQEAGLLDENGRLTKKGHDQLNQTRSWPLIRSKKTGELV